MRYFINHHIYFVLICLIVTANNCGQQRIVDAHKATPLLTPPSDLIKIDEADRQRIQKTKQQLKKQNK